MDLSTGEYVILLPPARGCLPMGPDQNTFALSFKVDLAGDFYTRQLLDSYNMVLFVFYTASFSCSRHL